MHPQGFSAYDPRRRYLTGPRPRRRFFFGAYDPRRRYLTGPISAADIADMLAAKPIPAQSTPGYQAQVAAALATPAPAFPMGPTAYVNLLAPPSGAAAGGSWFSRTNSLFGVSNGTLAIGIGAIGLLAMLSARKR